MADQFPDLLKAAASEFTNSATAFAQFRREGNDFKARLQAVEIMYQFVGDVTFGQDPKGILFYRNVSDCRVTKVNFDYQRFNGPGTSVTIRVNFRAERGRNDFARFLARFDSSKYPIPLQPTAGGNGRWLKFKAATAQVDAVRQTSETELSLQVGPIHKEVLFDTSTTGSVDTTGVLIFHDVTRLKDFPWGDSRRMLVDFAPDRIVFYLQPTPSEGKNEFGLFLPVDPVATIGPPRQGVAATWQDFVPDFTALSLASAEEEEHDEAN